jgi:pyruvate dehydrogenase (quinone)
MQIDNVADLIAQTLIQAGVKRIFGVVGDSLNGLTGACAAARRSQVLIR